MHPRREKSADSLLFTMGAATVVVTVLASVMIALPNMLWLGVAYGGLLVLAGGVFLFVTKFIDADL